MSIWIGKPRTRSKTYLVNVPAILAGLAIATKSLPALAVAFPALTPAVGVAMVVMGATSLVLREFTDMPLKPLMPKE